jgi:hypothetical protein
LSFAVIAAGPKPAKVSVSIPTFNIQRHLTSRRALRVLRGEAFRTWRVATAA